MFTVAPRRTYDVPLTRGRVQRLGERTLVMGILNVTPDSFSDGGRFAGVEAAVAAARAMVEAGADIVDVGGETTRPGAEPVDAVDELRRVLPVIERLSDLPVPISIDTYKAEVADAALAAGAAMVNDISGLQYDSRLAAVVARHQAGLVLMHMRGTSRDMYREAHYGDLAGELAAELAAAVARAQAAGVPREAIVLDPGIGFAKRPEHSWAALVALGDPRLVALDRPWLSGPSRKSFLTSAVGDVPAGARDWATAAAATAAILAGAHIVRVHRAAEMVHVARVADRVRRELSPAAGVPQAPDAGR